MKKPSKRAELDPTFPTVPPPDPEALAEAARRMLRKPKPEGGWRKGDAQAKKEGDGK